jgi:chitin synthase
MCLEIVAKKGENYIIHYVPGAKCLTDPPLTLMGLIKQRRRWFNGSLFASIHVLKHMWRVWQRGR